MEHVCKVITVGELREQFPERAKGMEHFGEQEQVAITIGADTQNVPDMDGLSQAAVELPNNDRGLEAIESNGNGHLESGSVQ